jgi:hypothetical protein
MKIVILQNRDYRGQFPVPVIGRSGYKYGSAQPVAGKRLLEFRMPFSDWQEACWDIALGGRRAGYTFFVADIVDADAPVSEPEPEPTPAPVEEPPAPEPVSPLETLPEPEGQSSPPQSSDERRAELEAMTPKALKGLAKVLGADPGTSATTPAYIDAILAKEFPNPDIP